MYASAYMDKEEESVFTGSQRLCLCQKLCAVVSWFLIAGDRKKEDS